MTESHEKAKKQTNSGVKGLVVSVLIVIGILVFGACIAPDSDTETSPPVPPSASRADAMRAITAVGAVLDRNNQLGVTASHLRSIDNPRGDGILVYHPETRFSGVERYLIWLVLDGTPHPLNGPSKTLTPNQPWPRDAGDRWDATGLGQYSATDAIAIVFGR